MKKVFLWLASKLYPLISPSIEPDPPPSPDAEILRLLDNDFVVIMVRVAPNRYMARCTREGILMGNNWYVDLKNGTPRQAVSMLADLVYTGKVSNANDTETEAS